MCRTTEFHGGTILQHSDSDDLLRLRNGSLLFPINIVNYDDYDGDHNDGAGGLSILCSSTVKLPTMKGKKQRRKRPRQYLEDIPEAAAEAEDIGESPDQDDDDPWTNTNELPNKSIDKDMDMEMELEESVRWAIDLGVWVMCLGVGYLVSKASAKTLTTLSRGRIL